MSTNLPITSGAPQTQTIAARNANGNNAAEAADAQTTLPFGEVLAKQIRNPLQTDLKADIKLVAETLAAAAPIAIGRGQAVDEIGAETIPVVEVEDGSALQQAALPADMLATMLPQAMNSASLATPATGTKSDGIEKPALYQSSVVPGSTGGKGKTAGETTAAAVAANGNTPAAKAGEQNFTAAMIESANRLAAREFGTVVREVAPIPVTPQPGTNSLASMQATAASFATPTAQAAAQATVNTPIGREKWGEEFSQRITLIASARQDQTAELHLNPPRLGPLDVVLKISGDQATALFTSPHASVREAIEQALPRLRDMLAENGIALGNATVSDQATRDGSETARQKGGETGNSADETAIPAETQARISQISRHNGIVDTFA